LDSIIANLDKKDVRSNISGLDSLEELICSSPKQFKVASVSLDAVMRALPILIKSNNFKVSLRAIELTGSLCGVFPPNIITRYLIPTIMAVVDGFSSQQSSVRSAASANIIQLMQRLSPQSVFEEVAKHSQHKSHRVREGVMQCFMTGVTRLGAPYFDFGAFLPLVVPLLSDPNGEVRTCAVDCVCLMYQHVGPELHDALKQIPSLPISRVADLQLDSLPLNAPLVGLYAAPLPSLAAEDSDAHGGKQILQTRLKSPVKRVSATSKTSQDVEKENAKENKQRYTPSNRSMIPLPKSEEDTEAFEESFLDLESFASETPVRVYTDRSLEKEMAAIAETLRDVTTADWSRRVVALRRVTCLLKGGANELEAFYPCLQTLRLPTCAQVQDLRSGVVKEACRMLALLARGLRQDLETFADFVLPVLLKTQANNAVIRSSGHCGIKQMLRYARVAKSVKSLLDEAQNSKVVHVRLRCVEYLGMMVAVPAQAAHLEKHGFADAVTSQLHCALFDKSELVRQVPPRHGWEQQL